MPAHFDLRRSKGKLGLELFAYSNFTMTDINEIYTKQITAVLQVLHVAKRWKKDNLPCQIEEGLFLGSLGAAYNKEGLKSLNVTHILTVANAPTPAHPNDFVYKKIAVADREDTDLRQHFDECFDFIDEAKKNGGGVLVHCFAGRSRSVTIVVAYLMKKHQMKLSQALEHVKIKRPIAGPNAGFLLQLQNFESSLRGTESLGSQM